MGFYGTVAGENWQSEDDYARRFSEVRLWDLEITIIFFIKIDKI